MYHSETEADAEEANFIKTFSKKEIPDDLPELKPNDYNLMALLVEAKLASSKSDARRVIEQGGVKINQAVVKDINFSVPQGAVLQKGKINFLKVL